MHNRFKKDDVVISNLLSELTIYIYIYMYNIITVNKIKCKNIDNNIRSIKETDTQQLLLHSDQIIEPGEKSLTCWNLS